jgi:hypothetical protein
MFTKKMCVMKKFFYLASMVFSLSVLSGTLSKLEAQTTHHSWSKKKKNTVIGAGVGAATGAVVSKNHRAKGAVIGGAVGAGAGYLWGRHKQKKEGSK